MKTMRSSLPRRQRVRPADDLLFFVNELDAQTKAEFGNDIVAFERWRDAVVDRLLVSAL